MEQQEIWIKSTLDGSLQPSLFYHASKPNQPLLVGLHTWSFDRFNQIKNMLPFAEENDFNLLLPDFAERTASKTQIATRLAALCRQNRTSRTRSIT